MEKESKKEYDKEYSIRNKEKISERKKAYYLKNKNKIIEKQLSYYYENKEEILEKYKVKYSNNSESILEKCKIYYEKNKDSILEKEREKYKNGGKEKIKKRRKEDFLFKLKTTLGNRLRNFLKSKGLNKKNKRTFDIIGCDPNFLREYLEIRFKPGMNWDNHGEWHIDHIIPLDIALNEEEIFILSHYTNLQPLWKAENLSKGCKI